MKNLFPDLSKAMRRDKNGLAALSGFSQFTYDMYGVEVEVNGALIPLTSGVKNDLLEGRDFMEHIRFWALTETYL